MYKYVEGVIFDKGTLKYYWSVLTKGERPIAGVYGKPYMAQDTGLLRYK